MMARTLVLSPYRGYLRPVCRSMRRFPGAGCRRRAAGRAEVRDRLLLSVFPPPFSPFSRHQVKNFPIYFFITSPDKNLSSEQENNRNRKHISDDGDQIGRKRRNMESYRVRNRTTQLDERNHGNQKYNQIFGNHIHLSFFTKCYRFLVQRSYCSVMPAICPV